MADKAMKIPGPDHPISIDVNPSRVVVTVGGKVIADTRDALTLREGITDEMWELVRLSAAKLRRKGQKGTTDADIHDR